MRSTPNVELIYNRRHTATTTKEAAVELRVSFRKQQKYMATGIKLLPKHWHRGRVSARTDAILINQTLDKLVNDVRKVIYEMMEEGDIDIFTIPDRLNRMRTGNVSFLDYCEKRAEVRRFGKSADSKARYDRFMRKFREWGGIKDWADLHPDLEEFRKLMQRARHARFWVSKSDNGLAIDSVCLHYFLMLNGYYSYDDKLNSTEQQLVKIDGYKVKKVTPKDIRQFLRSWVEKNVGDMGVLNLTKNILYFIW